ncbi:uncharacterized protein LOC135367087 [Ornithodoros turicata]|uniref:uncharacterized protein LOC135367087 n=1 Tax=Ornithodoros turicata TaxID=34597 RepID=UPI0031397D26
MHHPTMLVRTVAFLFCILACHAGPLSSSGSFHTGQSRQAATQDLARWSDAGFQLVANVSCAFFASEKECSLIQAMGKSDIVFYAALEEDMRYSVVLPDEALTHAGEHDAVLVFDPFPYAAFGHLVVVFFLDLGWTQLQCQVNGGYYIREGECLSLALKSRCHNLLEGHHRPRNAKRLVRRCEMRFLPLVHPAHEEPHRSRQQLRCRDEIPGFAPCPVLHPLNETEFLMCNPVKVNTQRCSPMQDAVQTQCRLFETCDQAVLLSGGWDRLTSPATGSIEDLKSVYDTLTRYGFRRNNIKVFYANGAQGKYVTGDENQVLYPSALKLTFRYHLQRMCQSSRCVDSLFLYLNSPVLLDGSSLLWDVDGNGQADEEETYTIKELLFDLKNCSARQVILLADQNFSGELAKAFARSKSHNNVIFFGSTQKDEYAWRSELTRHWTSSEHATTCLREIQQAAAKAVTHSTPVTYDGSQGSIRKTLFGAPCDVIPPYSKQELEDLHFGCQNVPPSLWRARTAPLMSRP